MSQSRPFPADGGPAPSIPEFAASLLPLWGFPSGAGIAPADEQGEVTAHAGRLGATTRWLATNEDAFLSIAATANANS